MEPSGAKRIFISDIHMGDERTIPPNTIPPRYPYVWFNSNARFLEDFLDCQLKDDGVRKVIILGDLFDRWVIPTDYDPVKNFENICDSDINKQVIAKLRALANNRKLVYVPGNHDMAMNTAEMSQVKQFFDSTFPQIDFRCDANPPLGRYDDEILVAEHGSRYCLFNAPDTWTNPPSFLPLGYFITRMIAYKVSTGATNNDPRHIFLDLIESMKERPTFVEDLFQVIADYCGLTDKSIFKLDGIPDYDEGTLTVGDVKERFRNLCSNWDDTPEAEKINSLMAAINERDTLYDAANCTYFFNGSSKDIVIFGHTHRPYMKGIPVADGIQTFDDDENACMKIYANSGTWVDSAGEGGTYVETEEAEAKEGKRLYVRLKKYTRTEDVITDWGFVSVK